MKQVPLTYKIIGIALLLIIVTGFLKPNFAKKLYKRMMGEYEQVDKNLQRKMDSLNRVMRNDSIRYITALKAIDEQYELEIKEAEKKYDGLQRKYRKNAKELDDYRNSNFDGKFELFSIAVIGKDTVQGQ